MRQNQNFKKSTHMLKLKIFLLILMSSINLLVLANQNYADYSPLSPDAIRDLTHNLDLSKEEEQKLYYKYLLYFVEENEGFRPYVEEVYTNEYKENQEPTPIKKQIIGYGFNMNGPDAQAVWHSVFKGNLSFDAALQGKLKLNKEQAEKLLMYRVKQYEKALADIYDPYWEKFKPNERLSLTDIYFVSGPRYIGRGTKIYEYQIKYYQTDDPKFLEAACDEVRNLPE